MTRFLPFLFVILVLVGCTSFEDFGPGNTLAMENQTNIEKNVVRSLDNFEKLAKANPEWTAEDQKIFDSQKKAIIEQLAINYCWLYVIKGAAESDTLDAGFFGDVIQELPAWVAQGKQVYDLVESKRRK
jgi:hypothetical protein